MNGFLYSVILLSLASFTGARVADHDYTPPANTDLTVSYSIVLKSRKSDTGIGETYNGGVKTVFVSDAQVRLRLVSLMRMQSIFILPGGRPQQKVAIAKESGRSRYKYYLSESDWKQYNLKYEGLVCHLLDDTMRILGYTCRKAIITLKNKETVTVYYTPAILKPALADAEPLFSGVPGLALRYEYTHRKGTIIYTATNINQHSIDPTVFSVPGDDFLVKKYIPGKG